MTSERYTIAKSIVVSPVVSKNIRDVYEKNGLSGVESSCFRVAKTYGIYYSCDIVEEWDGSGPVREIALVSIYASAAKAKSVDDLRMRLNEKVPPGSSDYAVEKFFRSAEYRNLNQKAAAPIRTMEVVLRTVPVA